MPASKPLCPAEELQRVAAKEQKTSSACISSSGTSDAGKEFNCLLLQVNPDFSSSHIPEWVSLLSIININFVVYTIEVTAFLIAISPTSIHNNVVRDSRSIRYRLNIMRKKHENLLTQSHKIIYGQCFSNILPENFQF